MERVSLFSSDNVILTLSLPDSTQITAETTITPSPGAVQSSIASVESVHGQYAVKPALSNSAYIGLATSTQLVAIFIVLVTFVYFG